MNANQIINMVLRMVVGRFVRMGVDAGVNKMSNVGKRRPRRDHRDQDDV